MQIFFFKLDHRVASQCTRNDALRQNIRSSSLTAEQVSFSSPPVRRSRRAAGTPKVTSADANVLGARRERVRRLNSLGTHRIVIAAHFDLNGLAQRRAGLDERDHLRSDVFQQKALFGRDLGADRSRNGTRAFRGSSFRSSELGAARRSAEPANRYSSQRNSTLSAGKIRRQKRRAGSAARGSRSPGDVELRAALFGMRQHDAGLAFQALREIRPAAFAWPPNRSTSRARAATAARATRTGARARPRRRSRFAPLPAPCPSSSASSCGRQLSNREVSPEKSCAGLRLSSARWRPACPETTRLSLRGATPRTKPARIASGP